MTEATTAAERLAALHAEVEKMFAAGLDGRKLSRHMCKGVDALLRDIWRDINGDKDSGVDVVAVGGYGRGELCPHSDWDLWFLLPKNHDTAAEKDIERFMYALWDLGVKVGHGVWTVDEACAHLKDDWNAATAAMESRLLIGDGSQYAALQNRRSSGGKRSRKCFVEAKLAEFSNRRQRMGNTAFLMEPDIKEGKGGLRDVQALLWMARAWYGVDRVSELVAQEVLTGKELGQLRQAYHFLLRLRCGLHIHAGRASERLSFEHQAQQAEAMGYHDQPHRPAVEALMKRYFGHVGHVATIADMLVRHFKIELLPKRFRLRKSIGDGFVLEGRWLNVRDEHVFEDKPLRLLSIFHAAQQGHRRISSYALRLIREHAPLINGEFRKRPEAKKLFMTILGQPRNVAWALKEMNDTGVLGRFIPAFGRVTGLGQFDRYHAYTVDEHTVRAVAEVRNLSLGRPGSEELPLASEVMMQISRPDLLYIALLFHDIAKGRSGDHAEIGARLALRFCKSMGINRDGTELVSWLVEHHLKMAMTSQRCDLTDPEVIRVFACRVGDIERLRYLFLLTIADIRAVGPSVWSDWKGSLLIDLYRASERELMGSESRDENLEQRIHTRIKSTVEKFSETRRRKAHKILKRLPWRTVMHFRPRQLKPVVRLLRKGKRGQAVDIRTDDSRGETQILILAKNREALFAGLTSAIAAGHIQIVAAHAFDIREGQVLDVFHVQDAARQPVRVESDIERLKVRIDQVLEGAPFEPPVSALKVNVLMQRLPVEVRELPFASSQQTAIQVSAADRPGLLAELAHAIVTAGVDIRGASISTFGEKVVDVFFLSDRQGNPLQAELVSELCKTLKQVATLPENL